MKFRASVTELVGARGHPQLKRLSRQAVIALAIDSKNDGCLVVVLKPDKEKLPRVIQTKEIRSLHKTFASEGKVTLVLDATSFLFKAQPSDIRRFVAILDHFLKTGRFDKQYRLPNLYSLDLKAPKKEGDVLHVISAAQLPGSNGYPRNLTCLTIENVKMEEFDSRLLRLQHLRSLSLKAVGLKTIPNQLDLLPNLTTLNLSGNSLGLTSNWRWVCCSTLRENLLRLDLSNNQMRNVPLQVCRLSLLQELSLSSNRLKALPNAIGLMKNLRILLLNDNEIEWFPANILRLKLRTSHFPDSQNDIGLVHQLSEPCTSPPSLVDLAATVIVNERLKYSEVEVPRSLCDYMDNAIACLCTNLVLPPSPSQFCFSQLKLAEEMHYDAGALCVLGYRKCVKKCSKKQRIFRF